MNTDLIMKSAYSFLLAIVVTLQCTAYCDRGITASGEPVRDGICAVDRINGVLVPFGTIIKIKGMGTYKVTDRFGDGRNNCVDLFMESYKKCIEFGRQDREAEVEMP